MITAPDGTRTPSGIEVYAVRDLAERRAAASTSSPANAVGTAALALPLAVLLALLAAGSVLRPVRELRDTARRLAAGDLGARSPPRGADELAELTVTINEMAESVQTSMAAMRRMQADARRFVADVVARAAHPAEHADGGGGGAGGHGGRDGRRTPGSPHSWRSPRPTGWSGSSRT